MCWKQGSWFEPAEIGSWDLVVSNPPYIAASDAHLNQGDLLAEPLGALVGETGLEMLEHIVTEAPPYIRSSGWLLLEHGFDQVDPVRALLTDRGFSNVATRARTGRVSLDIGWAMAELTDSQLQARYARQLIVPQVDLEGQQRLQAARVLIVGAGGLGAHGAVPGWGRCWFYPNR